jgi:uncharacterized protein (DUF1800 family)
MIAPARPRARFAALALCLALAANPLPSLVAAAVSALTEESRAAHLLNRIAFGPRPGDLDRVRSVGIRAYVEEQLSPDVSSLPEGLARKLEPFRTLTLGAPRLYLEYGPPSYPKADREAAKLARQRARTIVEEAAAARLLRAIESPHQLYEVMVDFWFNHFNVFAGKGLTHLWIGAYEREAIRPHALGRFRDLLGATAKHPAMLFYLDNWLNTAPGSPGARGRFKGLNENYARELMELHTLGVDGGYTQEDVVALARIFTGWTIGRPADRERSPSLGSPSGRSRAEPGGFFFDPSRHDFGAKRFLGRSLRGSGIEEGEEALDILSRSPATARHIGYKLAQYFVADEPPRALVERLARRFLETDGDIREVLRTLLASEEFWAPEHFRKKFKTPLEYVVSAARAAGGEAIPVRPLQGILRQLGMPLYGCQTPDGYKNTQAAWLNPGAMTQRLHFASLLASGRLHAGGPAAVASPMGGGEASPVRLSELAKAIGPLSPQTESALAEAPPQLRPALLLGSPEFMYR